MQHRWMDPNHSFKGGDEPAIFVGGTGETDIWVVPETNVLICQYENDDVYVSYFPIAAVLDHAKGLFTLDTATPLRGDVRNAKSCGLRTAWQGFATAYYDKAHKPADIARYLAMFYPDAFSEAEREEALGIPLTEQGELK